MASDCHPLLLVLDLRCARAVCGEALRHLLLLLSHHLRRMSGVHGASEAVVRKGQRTSTAISGNQWQSAAISGNQW
eukprot:33879-Prymnesium_polylepis.2